VAWGENVVGERMGHGKNVSSTMDNGLKKGGPTKTMGPEKKKVPMEIICPWESLGRI